MLINKNVKISLRRLYLLEAIKSNHYLDRLYDRFLNKSILTVGYEIPGSVGEYNEVGTYQLTSDEKNNILKNAKIVEDYNFQKSKSYAIKIGDLRIEPINVSFFNDSLRNESKGKKLVILDSKTNSNGDLIYAVVRANEINTIYFAKSYIQQTTDKIKVDYIIKNLDNLVKPEVKVDKLKQLDLPTIEVNGDVWYFNQNNNELISTKDINKKINVDDAPIEYLEKIMDILN